MKNIILVLSILGFSFNGFADHTKIALVQYKIEGQQTLPQILKKVRTAVQQAKKNGASLVVFPEFTILDHWPKELGKKTEAQYIQEIAQDLTPQFVSAISEIAKSEGIYVLAGSAPYILNKKIYNSALLSDPKGMIEYRPKVFLTKWERDIGIQIGRAHV